MLKFVLVASACCAGLFAQDSGSAASDLPSPAPVAASTSSSTPIDHRAYGILPNYRTANFSDPFEPISTSRKFKIATKDSFDYPIFFLGGVFAGLGQLDNAHANFGQGAEGFAKRYVTSFADQAI